MFVLRCSNRIPLIKLYEWGLGYFVAIKKDIDKSS